MSAATEPETAKRTRFPSAFTILAVLLLLVFAASFLIPAGAYDLDADGAPKPGTYHRIDDGPGFKDRLTVLFTSPASGFYGIEDSDGQVTPTGSGDLFGAIPIVLFVLAVGGFVAVTMRSGALDAGLARLAHRYADRGPALIAVLMVVFSVGGTTYGMAEETLGFYALLVPLLTRLGYDRMLAVGVILVGSHIGVLASTVNPFSTGVASGIAGVGLGDGLALRLVAWVVLTAVAVAYVLLYARRIRADPARSLVDADADALARADAAGAPPATTRRQRVVLALFALTFVVMIVAIVPWQEFFGSSFPALNWYFPELACLFIVSAVLIGSVGGLGEGGTTDAIVAGAREFLAPALIIGFARAITVVMNDTAITPTVLDALGGLVGGLPGGVFAVIMFVVNLPIAVLVPSSSGHATLAMPVLAPLADVVGEPRSLVVTAYQSASGLAAFLTPTSAVLVGSLVLARVPFDRYLRFVLPLVGAVFVLVCALMALGAAGLG